MPVYANIGGVQKELTKIYANVGGAQKQLNSLLANIGGVQRELLVTANAYWDYDRSGTGTLSAGGMSRRMAADKVSVDSTGNFTLINPAQITGQVPAGKYYVSTNTTGTNSTTAGLTIYYATNGSGAYDRFNMRTGVILNTANFPAVMVNSDDSVVHDTAKFYVSKNDVPLLYRWTQYNATAKHTYGDECYYENNSIFFGSAWGSPNVYLFPNNTVQYTADGQNYLLTLSLDAETFFDNFSNYQYWRFATVSIASYIYDAQSITRDPLNCHDYTVNSGYVCRRVVTSTDYTKGTATGRYAFSPNSAAYPTDGYSSSFWYANRTTVT